MDDRYSSTSTVSSTTVSSSVPSSTGNAFELSIDCICQKLANGTYPDLGLSNTGQGGSLYLNLQEVYKKENHWVSIDGMINNEQQLLYCISIVPTNPMFIGFTYVEDLSNPPVPSEQGTIFEKHGLKLHISLPEWDFQLYAQAHNILIPLLLKERVNFKILRRFSVDSHGKDCTNFMSQQQGQAGKDITIYVNLNPEKTREEWRDLCIKVTQTLVTNNIPPGYQVKSLTKPEVQIPGSNYLSYRYEVEDRPSLNGQCHNYLTKRRAPGSLPGSDWPIYDPMKKMLPINVGQQQAARIYSSTTTTSSTQPNNDLQ
jgi:hypothetical protein